MVNLGVKRAIGFNFDGNESAILQFVSGKIVEMKPERAGVWTINPFAGCENHDKCNDWSCVWQFGKAWSFPSEPAPSRSFHERGFTS